MTTHLGPHDCDALLAGLVSKDRATLLGAHAGACAACAHRLREASAARDAFLIGNPPSARAHALLAQVRPARLRWASRVAAAGGLVAAGLALLLVRLGSAPVLQSRARHGDVASSDDRGRWKGGRFICQLRRGEEIVAVLAPQRELVPAAAGDTLTCAVAPRDKRRVEIWGWDEGESPARLRILDGGTPSAASGPYGDAFVVSPARGSGELRLYFIESDVPLPGENVSRALVRSRTEPHLPPAPLVPGARVESIGVVVP
jgi:hypothetical protein